MQPDDPHDWLEPDEFDAGPSADGGGAASGGAGADRVAPATERRCARVGCGAVAVATMTADYAGRAMAVGPLSPERVPPALDLCARHRDALTPPDGWELFVHDPDRA